MYNDVVTFIGCILNVIGTIWAIFCVIKMSIKDVLYTRTTYGLDHAEFGVLEQKYCARIGIGIIVIGAIVQIVAIFIKEFTLQCMLTLIVITVFVLIILVIEEKIRYGKDKKWLENR